MLQSQHTLETTTDCFLGRLIQVLLRESQNIILQAPSLFIRTAPVGEEHPRVHEPHEPPKVALLHVLDAPPVPLRRALVPDGPVRVRGPRHALGALVHVALADQEAGDVHDPVGPAGEGRVLVALVLGQALEAEQGRDGAAALRERAGVDPGGAVVEEGDGARPEVEAVAVGGAA